MHRYRWRIANAPTCSIEGCEKPAEKKGWCGAHYFRARVHGDPLAGGKSPGGVTKYFDEVVVEYKGDQCLKWPFGLCNGYPYLSSYKGRKAVYLTRLICELRDGPPPSPDHEAAHSCGNSWCCNPTHLRWATPTENQNDKLIHGTDLRGSKHPSAKLTEDAVREIRRLYGSVPQRELATKYGVDPSVISRVSRGSRSWAWLKD